jgi:hypothetical protein
MSDQQGRELSVLRAAAQQQHVTESGTAGNAFGCEIFGWRGLLHQRSHRVYAVGGRGGTFLSYPTAQKVEIFGKHTDLYIPHPSRTRIAA